MKTDFLLNFDNKAIYDVYCCKANYYIEKLNPNSRKCIIFFSSNGLYFPNQYEVFKNIIIEQDRYEWQNIAQSKKIRKYYGKAIFVRDVYKQWYVAGISREYNSLNRVIELLKKETKGYEVYTIGSSAGGYMAAICGVKLHAKMVINLSGQYNLKYGNNHEELILMYGNDSSRNQYYDISDKISSDTPIFYFYPAQVEWDVEQSECVRKKLVKNVYFFPIKSKLHGHTIKGKNIPYVLVMNEEKWMRLYKNHEDREMRPYFLFLLTAGVVPCLSSMISEYLMKLKEMLYLIKIKVLNKLYVN